MAMDKPKPRNERLSQKAAPRNQINTDAKAQKALSGDPRYKYPAPGQANARITANIRFGPRTDTDGFASAVGSLGATLLTPALYRDSHTLHTGL